MKLDMSFVPANDVGSTHRFDWGRTSEREFLQPANRGGASIPYIHRADFARSGQRFREGGSEQASLFVFQRLFREWLCESSGESLPITSIMEIMGGNGVDRLNPGAIPELVRELRTISSLARAVGLSFNPLTQMRLDLKKGQVQLQFGSDASLVDRALLANLGKSACDPDVVRREVLSGIDGLSVSNIGVFAMGGPLLATAVHECLTRLPGVTGWERGWHNMSNEKAVDIFINSARDADQLSLAGWVMDGWIGQGIIDDSQKTMAMMAFYDRVLVNIDLRLQYLSGASPSFTSVGTLDNAVYSLKRSLSMKAIPPEWRDAANACERFVESAGGERVVRQALYDFLDVHGKEGLSQFAFVVLPQVILESGSRDVRENALRASQAFDQASFFGLQECGHAVRWTKSNVFGGSATRLAPQNPIHFLR
jgi:hypothetical protein